MATKAASKRLGKEAQSMEKDPPPFCFARPREENILEWHFILRGPPDTPYQGGEYWGQLIFPSDYPFKPPGIKMTTPSGRFKEGMKICTSMSDYHPGTWNPSWSVSNILVGLLSFMCSDEITTGSIAGTEDTRKSLAARSHAWNITQARFKTMFPEFTGSAIRDLPNMGQPGQRSAEKLAGAGSGSTSTAVSKERVGAAAKGSLMFQGGGKVGGAAESSSGAEGDGPRKARTSPPPSQASSSSLSATAHAADPSTATDSDTAAGLRRRLGSTPTSTPVLAADGERAEAVPLSDPEGPHGLTGYSGPAHAAPAAPALGAVQQRQLPPQQRGRVAGVGGGLLGLRQKVLLALALFVYLFLSRLLSSTSAGTAGGA